MEIITPFREALDEIKEAGGETFKYCYQCGLCDTVCPWNRVSSFSMRHLVRQAAFGLPEIEGQDIWRCTTCGSCPQQCPRGVGTSDVAVSFRRIATKYGISPEPVHTVSASLGTEGNPLREARSGRADWAKELSVKFFTEGMEILYFPGCYPSYDPRLKKVAAATVTILNKAGVDFGILGVKENCCGVSIRKAGNETLYKRLARENIKAFIDNGVHRILVSSPHCYHTFKNEYPEFNVNFEIVHITQYLSELVREGRLELKGEYGKRITYHDPCYLGRHNGIYEEPRNVLNHVPGLELVEMAECRENSFCCGGGGGRIWMDTAKGDRFSDLRLEQAVEISAEELVTACPYCITNFEDSRLSVRNGNAIVIKDITEIICEVI
ncbi:MAG: (Fe-S)-binding protein [Dehalococcoidales bacterium]|nr:MAG: (Fe-S)-binding protein [Dehalococcoidales bacterium]